MNIDYDDNDEKMKKDYIEQLTEMFTSAGFKNIQPSTNHQAPGLDIHEWVAHVWARIQKHPS